MRPSFLLPGTGCIRCLFLGHLLGAYSRDIYHSPSQCIHVPTYLQCGAEDAKCNCTPDFHQFWDNHHNRPVHALRTSLSIHLLTFAWLAWATQQHTAHTSCQHQLIDVGNRYVRCRRCLALESLTTQHTTSTGTECTCAFCVSAIGSVCLSE